MTTILSIFFALNLVWAWAYRGGSSGLPIPYSRWASLLSTPLFIGAALVLAYGAPSYLAWSALVIGCLGMMAAQADGWGNQMDLGSNDKPDTETGHRVRDWFFKSKSSFGRDLLGLYMRMAQFAPAALCFYFFTPLAAIVPAALVAIAPLIWVAEHKFIKGTRLADARLPWNRRKAVAWVEWSIGVMNATTTLLAIALG